MYPPELVNPMRKELSSNGFTELRTAEDVDQVLQSNDDTVLVVVNSVCGCAAGAARPGVIQAITKSSKLPVKLTTVFAGVDQEATARARAYMLPYPPSSPSIALFKQGKLVEMIERRMIEGRSAQMISEALSSMFAQHC